MDPTNLNATWKDVIAILAIGFNVGVIVYLIYCGNDKNSLHASAMAWSYLTNLGILVSFGFASLVQVLTLGRDPQK